MSDGWANETTILLQANEIHQTWGPPFIRPLYNTVTSARGKSTKLASTYQINTVGEVERYRNEKIWMSPSLGSTWSSSSNGVSFLPSQRPRDFFHWCTVTVHSVYRCLSSFISSFLTYILTHHFSVAPEIWLCGNLSVTFVQFQWHLVNFTPLPRKNSQPPTHFLLLCYFEGKLGPSVYSYIARARRSHFVSCGWNDPIALTLYPCPTRSSIGLETTEPHRNSLWPRRISRS